LAENLIHSSLPLLTSIGTVITVHENPFPFIPISAITKESEEGKSLAVIRKNTLNVFRQISKANGGDSEKNPVMTLQVRQFLRPGHDRGGQASRDASSLLFYYIFDDWYSAYNLVVQKDHQYELKLEELVSHRLVHQFEVSITLTLSSGRACSNGPWWTW
jgi:hypothetical protein